MEVCGDEDIPKSDEEASRVVVNDALERTRQNDDDAILSPKTDANSNDVDTPDGPLKSLDDSTEKVPISGCSETQSAFPDVYHVTNIDHQERIRVYTEDILGDCRPDQIAVRFAQYVLSHIEPAGWRAVWRSSSGTTETTGAFDVLVEVDDVRPEDLNASVHIVSPFLCDRPEVQQASVESLLASRDHMLPLSELWPLYDENCDHGKTALVIEHIRFFYDNIWRPWDEDDEEDYSFVLRHLGPRLMLYHDLHTGAVPPSTTEQYHVTLALYQQRLAELDKFEDRMGAADSDSELDSNDVLECARRHEELDALKRSIQVMENPMMRQTICFRASTTGPGVPKGPRPDGERVTHLISDKMTVGMVTNLGLPPETTVQYHTSLQVALDNTFEGDTVLLFPGRHVLSHPIKLCDPITIRGVGNPDDVTVEIMVATMQFAILCSSFHVTMSDLTLQASCLGSTINVTCGWTKLEKCRVKCGGRVGVKVQPRAVLTMMQCEVTGATQRGIDLEAGCEAEIVDNVIHGHGSGPAQGYVSEPAAIRVQTLKPSQDSPDTLPPPLVFKHNRIGPNIAYGLQILVDQMEHCCLELNPGTPKEHALRHNFRWIITEGNTFVENALGDVEICPSIETINFD
ncbi:SHC SH2 domain-binding protein 1 homolog A-like [Branchiostoma lanceolatum]|uniref:SHC SH2 domain-binding protein 1 homolog A-like n=1 Tax=Branchiostoma lanceolatum TaxID=7740 RepID=UPI003451D8DC